MLRHKGMCGNFGLVFARNPLTRVPFFMKKLPNYGSDFLNFPELAQILKILCILVAKLQEMGTFFQKNP